MSAAAPPRTAAVLVGAVLLLGCFEPRERPGPPQLAITLDTTFVTSPDTLTGRVRARDADGIDSLWLIVDSVRFGQEAFLNTTIDVPFLTQIPPNRPAGFQVVLRFEARDAFGFVAGVDTFVTVTRAQGR